MATSSITHDFVIKDKENATKFVAALNSPKRELPKPGKKLSGEDAIKLLMAKWKDEL